MVDARLDRFVLSRALSSGMNKQWGDILGPDDLELYAKRIREFLSPAEVAWFENGDKRRRRD